MICPNCGEENSPAFRFCGMCGTPLDARSPATVATKTEPAAYVPPAYSAAPFSPKVQPVASSRPAEPDMHLAMGETSHATISGPSLLGLSSDSVGESSAPSYSSPSYSDRSMLLEPEEPRSGMGRTLVLLALLAAICAAAWWTYKNYKVPSTQTAQSLATDVAKPSASTASSATSQQPAVSQQTTSSAQQTTPSAQPTKSASTAQPETAPPGAATSTTPPPTQPSAKVTTKPEAPPSPRPPANTKPPAQSTHSQQPASKPAMEVRASRAAPTHVEKPPAAAASNAPGSGDADYRKGEAYLYGRGAAENCDEAVKYLKSASAQQSAKARSTFGTMYATGHCVPRDLPTSYRWFALALQADPNNPVLTHDLTAIWNQMTPPERQIATKAKQ